MSTVDVVVDQRPVDLAPVDTSVTIPEHVRRAAELAESFYKKPEEPAKEAAIEKPVEAPWAGDLPPAEAPPAPEAPPPVQAKNEPVTPTKQEIHENDWASRYNSMKGRYDAAQRTIGSMQEQMSQLGDELVRTQALLRGQQPVEQQRPTNNNVKLITAEDEQAYGPELIDLARRAAAETLGPEIEMLRSQNQSLQKRVTTTAQSEVRSALDSQVPNWKAVNKSPEFKQWLSLRNVYTGEVRQQMLNEAYSAADAPKVAAFFKDFLREGIATGQVTPAPQQEQPPAPRIAAVPLETLAAPGRARPASGESPASPADKPIYTRAQIATFYSHVRQGAYAGRETEKARLEQSIFAAQAEGRVR